MVAELAEGAPLALQIALLVTGGTISSTTLSLPAGEIASAPLNASRNGMAATRITPVAPALPPTRCGEFDQRRCYQGFTVETAGRLTLFKDRPAMTGEVPRVELGTRGDNARVDLSALFSAADGGALRFTAVSSDPGLATVIIRNGVLEVVSSEDGPTGTVEITVTATDDDGLSVTATFAAVIEHIPVSFFRAWRRLLVQEAIERQNDDGD